MRYPLWYGVTVAIVVFGTCLRLGCAFTSVPVPKVGERIHSFIASMGGLLVAFGFGILERGMGKPVGALLFRSGHADPRISSAMAWSAVVVQWALPTLAVAYFVFWAERTIRAAR